MAVYSHGGELDWRTVEDGNLPLARFEILLQKYFSTSGNLPLPRSGLRATLVDDTLYVTGGYYAHRFGEAEEENDFEMVRAVHAWDPVGETWRRVGMTKVERDGHAAVAVPRYLFASECAAQ